LEKTTIQKLDEIFANEKYFKSIKNIPVGLYTEIKNLINDSRPLQEGVILQKGEIEEKYIKFRDYILEKEKEGKIVINTIEGFAEMHLDEIINQHTEGLLYDLNRDRATILTLIEDEKWVNDFACMKVIEKLKALLSK